MQGSRKCDALIGHMDIIVFNLWQFQRGRWNKVPGLSHPALALVTLNSFCFLILSLPLFAALFMTLSILSYV